MGYFVVEATMMIYRVLRFSLTPFHFTVHLLGINEYDSQQAKF